MDISKSFKACFISAKRENLKFGATKIYTNVYHSNTCSVKDDKKIWWPK